MWGSSQCAKWEVGDGTTDDTAAINNAILAGGRCGQGCTATTTTPAVVYFPAGTYLISSSILDQYYKQLIGDPTNVLTLPGMSSYNCPSAHLTLLRLKSNQTMATNYR